MGVHSLAIVSDKAQISEGSQIWRFAEVREDTFIGENVIIGSGAYIDVGVYIGENSKIQSSALLYSPARLGSGVFIGPNVVLTNDRYPRAVNIDGSKKSRSDWSPVGVTIHDGASIGAGSICVAPVSIGKWATVAAGSVVVRDVPDFGLMAGIPAKRIGWVGHAGHPLEMDKNDPSRWKCPVSTEVYVEVDGKLMIDNCSYSLAEDSESNESALRFDE